MTTETNTAETITMYRLSYIDSEGVRQSPALDDDADLFDSEQAAQDAADELEAEDPGTWGGADWRIEEA